MSFKLSGELKERARKLRNLVNQLIEEANKILQDSVNNSDPIGSDDNINCDGNPLLVALEKLGSDNNSLKRLARRWKESLFWGVRGLDTVDVDPIKSIVANIAGEIEYLSGLIVHFSEDIKLKFPETILPLHQASAWCRYIVSELVGDVPIQNFKKMIDSLAELCIRTIKRAEQIADYIDAYEIHKLEESGIIPSSPEMGASERGIASEEDVKKLFELEEKPVKPSEVSDERLGKIKLTKRQEEILRVLCKENRKMFAREIADSIGLSHGRVRTLCAP
ncbi:MAG: hypothetical protein J7L14_03925, partial [Candidatus Diapherotrites archaeon]|nr:hypothetical protein [Candidatus Diapherotrites archaeon]